MLMDGPDFHQVPATHLHGCGVVWHFDLEPFGLITREMLEAQRPALRDGDMLLIHTGWAQRFGTDTYMDNPALTVEAAEWLVDQGIKLVGMDFVTPDLGLPRRPPDFDWPVHQVLLSNGVLIAENLAEFGHLAGERIELVCGALNIEGADGSPARILARTVEP
jgi:kynurenine formamidase